MAHTPPQRDEGQGEGRLTPFGEYLLERRIAVGGTSEVYLARPAHGKLPAERLIIKRLLPAHIGDPQAVSTFLNEARLHRWVRHPNVVKLYEAGSVDGEPYLALEWVDGADTDRVLRRAQHESAALPELLAIYVACCVCDALEAVHSARDDRGMLLGIQHRDVTPSNIYLSKDGAVLLGDFGIARELTKRATLNQLKGKYGYLAPEQVSGEPVDHRADLFSLAVVTSELILSAPLFAGSGQLAVLLAIRDGRIDALRSAAPRLSMGLFGVLAKALSREPADRYQSARELKEALVPFMKPSPEAGRALVQHFVGWVLDTGDLARRIKGALEQGQRAVGSQTDDLLEGLEEPTSQVDTARPGVQQDAQQRSFDDGPITARIDEKPSRLRRKNGTVRGPIAFAALVEMIVTGDISGDDEVDLMGEGFKRVSDIELLKRHLPDELTTRNLEPPREPDEATSLEAIGLLTCFGRLVQRRETGLLLVEGRTTAGEPVARRELYFVSGQLHHVASPDASELLGRSLVRQGILTTEELDMALAVLSRFNGRLGDTLIALGLVDAVRLFRLIEEQGRGRLLRLFALREGKASFYRGVTASRVEFPLDLPVAPLMVAGVEQAPAEVGQEWVRANLNKTARRGSPVVVARERKHLPESVMHVHDALGMAGMTLKQLLVRLKTTNTLSAPEALRSLLVAEALGIVELG